MARMGATDWGRGWRPRSGALARAIVSCCSRPLPGTATPAVVTLALFVGVQIADASLTAVGVSRFGVSAEANPLVAFYIGSLGLVRGLIVAKAIALAAGAMLHAYARHLIVVLLTVLVVFAAVVPWAWQLALAL
jgi:hypothetical protein